MAEAKMLNLARALARIASLPSAVRAAVDAQLTQEAADLAEAIKRAVPVRSGVLKSTIKTRPGPHPLSRIISAGGPETTVKIRAKVREADFAKAKAEGGNKGEFDYARAVEFGHLTEAGEHVPPEPFFFPTYRARRKAAKRRLSTAARKAAKAQIEG